MGLIIVDSDPLRIIYDLLGPVNLFWIENKAQKKKPRPN